MPQERKAVVKRWFKFAVDMTKKQRRSNLSGADLFEVQKARSDYYKKAGGDLL